jgi:hypothetical protein
MSGLATTRPGSLALAGLCLLTFSLAASAAAKPGTNSIKAHGGLHLDFQTVTGSFLGQELAVGQTASYRPSTQVYSASVSSDFADYPQTICFSNVGSNFTMELVDRSSYRVVVPGIGAMSFVPSTSTQSISGGQLRCLGLPASPADLNTDPSFDPMGVCNVAQSSEVIETQGDDIFFNSSFEAGETGGGGGPAGSIDVRLAVNLLAYPTPLRTDPIRYEIYAVNCGVDPVSNIRVQDFAPIDNPVGGSNPDSALLDDSPVVSCQLSSGGDCTSQVGFVQALDASDLVFDSPYVLSQAMTLNGSEFARITVERLASTGTAGNVNDVMTLSFGVDAPGDADPSDNAFKGQVTLRAANNLAPQIIVGPSGQKTLLEDEGGGSTIALAVPSGQTLTPVSFLTDDPDGDQIANIQIVEVDDLGVPVPGPQAKIASAQVAYDADNNGTFGDPFSYPLPSPAGQFRIWLVPAEDANGDTRLQIQVTDDSAQGSVGVTDIDVSLTAVNDAPEFAVASMSIAKSADAVLGKSEDIIDGGIPCVVDDGAFAAGPTCADLVFPLADAMIAITIRDWLTSINEGAFNETSQSLSFEQLDPADHITPMSIPLEPVVSQIIDLNLEDMAGNPVLVSNSIFRQDPELQDLDGDGNFDLFLDFRGVIGDLWLRLTLADDGLTDAMTGNGDVNLAEVRVHIRVVDNLPPEVTVTGTAFPIDEDSANNPLFGPGFNVAAADMEGSITNVAVTSLNQAIIDDSQIDVDFSNPAAVIVTVTPESDAFGDVDLQVIATDDSMNVSAPVNFTVTVTGINDQPAVVFDAEASIEADVKVDDFNPVGPTLTINNDSGNSVALINGFLQVLGDSVLGINESSQALTVVSVSVSSDPSGVFFGSPSISAANGTLAYLLANNAVTGTATLDITVTDDGGIAGGGVETSQTMVLTVVVVD